MAAFYADENFPLAVVEALRRLGHDVLTAQEAGQANQRIADEGVLTFATGLGRAVLTMNRWDFIALHKSHPQHSGIISCTADADAERQAKRIDEALRGMASLAGLLMRVNRPT